MTSEYQLKNESYNIALQRFVRETPVDTFNRLLPTLDVNASWPSHVYEMALSYLRYGHLALDDQLASGKNETNSNYTKLQNVRQMAFRNLEVCLDSGVDLTRPCLSLQLNNHVPPSLFEATLHACHDADASLINALNQYLLRAPDSQNNKHFNGVASGYHSVADALAIDTQIALRAVLEQPQQSNVDNARDLKAITAYIQNQRSDTEAQIDFEHLVVAVLNNGVDVSKARQGRRPVAKAFKLAGHDRIAAIIDSYETRFNMAQQQTDSPNLMQQTAIDNLSQVRGL